MEHAVEKLKQAKRKSTALSRRETEPDREQAPMHLVLQLQEQAGNHAVQELLQSGVVQAKLAIGEQDTPDEREADRAAEQVMPMPEPHSGGTDERLQRKPAESRSGSPQEKSAPPSVHEVLRTSGQPLDPATRSFMEARFDHDFGDVQVHTDSLAARSAKEIQARAYTAGTDVVFADDEFSPATTEGRKLLAHELAHVVQQERGGSSPPPSEGGMLEHAADAAATAVVSGHDPVPVAGASAPGVARQTALAGLELSTGIKPRSLHASLHAAALTTTELRQEIELIRQWLRANPSDPQADYLRLELDRLQTALQEKQMKEVSDAVNIAKSPRYIDNLFEDVTFYDWNGAFSFTWPEGGKEKTVTIPLEEVIQNDSLTFAPLLEVHKTKAEAMNAVTEWAREGRGVQFYSFYERPDGVIMPTSFSIASTPKFHACWPGLKHQMVENRKDISRGLQSLANVINPIPGTTVDEYGKVGLSSNPMDWLALLKFWRLRKIREAGPITRRLHSGYDVRYRVMGPHERLSGTSVYVLKDAEGTVLYVGKGEALDRLREHIKDPKKTDWFGEIAEVEVRATGLNNTQALALEENLIGELQPLYNVDQHPFQKEFGTAMAVGPNLPPAQKFLKFLIEWGH